MNRRRRRASKAMEKKGLRGDWGEWQITNLLDGIPGGSGWCREVMRAYSNNLYAVLVRPFKDEEGNEIVHCAIRTASSLEPPWRDMQRIKNELFGEERTAVQVMPHQSELIDEADMYHMWVLPHRLPFSLFDREGKRVE